MYSLHVCKTTTFADVYLSLGDNIIPNHGYVMISDIGSTVNTALLCHTNRPATFGTDLILEETGLHQIRLELMVLMFQDQDSRGIEVLW